MKSYGAQSAYGPDIPLSVLRDVLLIVLAIFMPTRMGIMGILWSAPVADAIAMSITAVVVARVWKTMEVHGGSHRQKFSADTSIGAEQTAEPT